MTYLEAAEKHIPEGRDDILDRFIANCEQPLDSEAPSKGAFLLEAFYWKNSPEGLDFWQKVHRKIAHDSPVGLPEVIDA